MRKRSKKRIPQEQLPWVRISPKEIENIKIYHKKNSHWVSGNRRDAQTKIFNTLIKSELSNILLSSYLSNQENTELYKAQLQKKQNITKFKLNKQKNFCLFLGKGRTYSRRYYVSRQIIRKFTKFGLISGLQKK